MSKSTTTQVCTSITSTSTIGAKLQQPHSFRILPQPPSMLLVWRKHASVFGAASEEVGSYLSVVVETTETTTRCLFAS